jgi:hypothetical protein
MLEAGRYKARGVEGALGVAKNGTEQIAVLVEVAEGERAGARLTWFGFFTEKAIDRTFESLRHLGWQGDDITDLSGIDANIVEIIVEHEPDQNSGEMRPKVRWINRSGGGGIAMKDRMDPNAAASLAKAIASRVHASAPETAQHRTVHAPPKRAANGSNEFMDD